MLSEQSAISRIVLGSKLPGQQEQSSSWYRWCRRPQSLVSSTYATTYAPPWKPGRFRNQRSLTRARYGMPIAQLLSRVGRSQVEPAPYWGWRRTRCCCCVTLSTVDPSFRAFAGKTTPEVSSDLQRCLGAVVDPQGHVREWHPAVE